MEVGNLNEGYDSRFRDLRLTMTALGVCQHFWEKIKKTNWKAKMEVFFVD